MSDKKLKIKHYIGYTIADLGNNLGFAVTSSYLTVFYTDVLGKHFDIVTSSLWGILITIIMIVARVWDGLNDPIMGLIAQRAKPTKSGKYKRFLLIGGLPLCVIFILMFLPLTNLSVFLCVIFASITYIAYGMIYTVVLVPYASLATIMSRDEKERSKLSICRAIGGGIGSIPAGMLFPLIIYDKIIVNNESIKTINGNRLFYMVIILSIIMAICYIVSFKNIDEQYAYPKEENKTEFNSVLKSLIHNKPFIVMSLIGMLLIAASMFVNTIDIYLFNVYYQENNMMALVTIITYLPMLIMIPFTSKIISKMGKKEMCVISLLISSFTSLIMIVYKIPNPYIYLMFVFFQSFGLGFLTLEIWAFAMDVIDYQELITKKREEATCYSIFIFMRKIGQAIAAIVPALLVMVGYNSNLGYANQSSKTISGIYYLATIGPFIFYLLMLFLIILYPLNKANDKKMRNELKSLRIKKESRE